MIIHPRLKAFHWVICANGNNDSRNKWYSDFISFQLLHSPALSPLHFNQYWLISVQQVPQLSTWLKWKNESCGEGAAARQQAALQTNSGYPRTVKYRTLFGKSKFTTHQWYLSLDKTITWRASLHEKISWQLKKNLWKWHILFPSFPGDSDSK